MIRQIEAQKMCDEMLRKHNLFQKGWRSCFSKDERFIARCWHDAKRIEMSLMFLNTRSVPDLEQTLKHELAHALVGPNKGHNKEWQAKAKELGCNEEHCQPCVAAPPIDNGRGLQPVEVKEKKQFHRLNKVCPICQKTAVEQSFCMFGSVKWTKLQCGHLVKHDAIKSEGFDISQWTSESGKIIYPFQVEGIDFLARAGGRGLIADQPALGKTIQALGFIFKYWKDVCPVLWVCKGSLKPQALEETLDWCGPAFMAQIIDSPRAFIMPKNKIYIISMDLLRNMPTEKLEKIGFKTVVADEIQHFKNPDSTRTAELRKLVSMAEYFLPLSGTPWENRGQEYFPVLNMIDPVRFPSYESFKHRWVSYYFDQKSGKTRQGGIKNIKEFREYTKDIVIRRMRDDVLKDLPKIQRNIRFISMDDFHTNAYAQEEEIVAAKIKAAMIDGTEKNLAAQLQGDLMVLKHIAGLSKCAVAVEDAVEFLENTDDAVKLTIFHHHIDVGDQIQKGNGHTFEGIDKWLVDNGYEPSLRLYGGRSPDERNEIRNRFKNEIKCRVLIASTRASGEGLNLQFCQNMMQVERDWNPQKEEQAELRFSRPLTWDEYPPYLQAHLFNEDRTPKKIAISAPYLIAHGTLDGFLTEIVERKRHEFKRSMNVQDEDIQWSENDIMRELATLILKNVQRRKDEAARLARI